MAMTIRWEVVTKPVTILAVLVQLMLFSMFVPVSSGQEIIFEHNEIWGGGSYNFVSKSQAMAQSFTASASYTLTKVSLHVWAGKVVDLNVTLQTSNFGLPSSTVIGYFTAISPPPTVNHEWMTFQAQNVIDIEENSTYWIVATCGEATPNGYRWYTSNGDMYPDGIIARDDTGDGDTWTLESTDDQMFRIWGAPLSSTIYFDIVVDKSYAEPGDELRYTLFFNNTGNADSAKVWINDTLPSGLEYVGDTASSLSSYAGGYRDGDELHFNFTDVAPGSHWFVLRVKVNESHPTGTEITNWAYMDYTDSMGFYVSSLGDGATTRVDFNEPSILVSIVCDLRIVESQDVVTYTIFYNNTGTGIANHVWINDTIPENVEFLTSNPPADWFDRQEYGFVLPNVGPGVHSLTITARIPEDLTADSIFVNNVQLNYTNSRDIPIEGSYDSVISMVATGSVPTESPLSASLLASIIIVVGSVSAGATFVYMNRRKSAIDEVFLLYRSGELIKHYTRRIKPDVDSDILSGMLVAVQDFVGDSFRFKKGQLNRLKFGEYQIAMIRCKHTILAAVTAGAEPRRLEGQLKDACTQIEKKFGDVLRKWSGMPDELDGADEIIRKVIMDRY